MISIANKTRQSLPNLPWKKIVETALGPDYELSLVFIGHKRSQKLNFNWRNKNKPTNILSFPLAKDSGEIFINLKQAETEALTFYRNKREHIGALLIHGLMHLKGYEHSSTMERREEALRNRFNLNGQKHLNRHRHRHHLNSSGSL